MRRFIFAFMIAVPLTAAVAFAATQAPTSRVYIIDNNLTDDQAMSTGTPSVPCTKDWLKSALQVKCPSRSSWQTVRIQSDATVSCPTTDSDIQHRDDTHDDPGEYATINWQCGLDAASAPSNAVRSQQVVDFSGKLSLCSNYTITAQLSCKYFLADGSSTTVSI